MVLGSLDEPRLQQVQGYITPGVYMVLGCLAVPRLQLVQDLRVQHLLVSRDLGQSGCTLAPTGTGVQHLLMSGGVKHCSCTQVQTGAGVQHLLIFERFWPVWQFPR